MIVGALEIQMMADLAQLRKDMSSANAEMEKTAKAADFVANSIKAAFAGISVAAFVKEFVQTADAIQNMDARLKLATKTQEDFHAAQQNVYDISQRNLVSLESTAKVYARLNPIVEKMGGNTNYTAAVTEALSAALRVSGASTQEASSVMIQFSQAMSSGALRGEEFNSVSENGSRVLDALSNQLGKSRGELREMAKDGKLTADVVGNALVAELKKLRKEAAEMPLTVAGAWQRMTNDMALATDALNKHYHITQTIAEAMEFLRKNMDTVKDAFVVGLKVATAYFLLFHGVPAVIAACVAAFELLVGVMAHVMTNGVIASGAMTTLSGTLVMANSATLTLVTSMSALQVALGVVFAAFVGWEIGTWARKNFLEVELFGIAMVTGLLKSWEALKYGFNVVIETIVFAWEKGIGTIQGFVGYFLEMFAQGLEKMGLSESSAKVMEWAGSFKSASAEVGTLTDRLKPLSTEYDRATAEIDDNMNSLVDNAIAAREVVKAVEATVEPLKASTKMTEEQRKALEALTKQYAAFAKASDIQIDKLRETTESGLKLTKSEEELIRMQEAIENGTLQYNKALYAKTAATLSQNAATERALMVEAQYQALMKKARDIEYEVLTAIKERTAKLNEEIERQNAANLTTLTGVDYTEKLAIAKLRASAASSEATANFLDEHNAISEQSIALREEAKALNELANSRETMMQMKPWADMSQQIGQGLTDSLFRAFESGKGFMETFWDGVKNMFKTTVLKMIIQPIAQAGQQFMSGLFGGEGAGGGGMAGSFGSWIGSGVSSMFGGSSTGGLAGLFGGAAAAGGGQTAFSMGGGFMGGLDTASGYMGSLLGGFATYGGSALSGIGAFMSSMGMTSAGAGMSAAGAGLSQASASMANFGPWGLLIALGMLASGKLYGKGFSDTSDNSTFGNVFNLHDRFNTSILRKIGVSDAMANVITGAPINSFLFGRSAKQYGEKGLEGTITGTGVTGKAWADWKQKGGLFRSNKYGTDFFDMPKDVMDALSDSAKAVKDGIGTYLDVLDIPAARLDQVSTKFKVKLTENEEENAKALSEALTAYQTALADSLSDVLLPFQVAGETMLQTLQRLTALELFSQTLNQLGGIFSSIAGTSIKTREAIVGLAGGLEAFLGKAQAFVQDYYTDAEKAGMQARDMLKYFQDAGVNITGVNSKEDFRKLVEAYGTKLDDEVAQKQLVALLNIAPQFAQLAAYLAENNTTLQDLATKAPTTALLESFNTRQAAAQEAMAAQQAAQQETTTAVEDGFVQLTDSFESGMAFISERIGQTNKLFENWDRGNAMQVFVMNP